MRKFLVPVPGGFSIEPSSRADKTSHCSLRCSRLAGYAPFPGEEERRLKVKERERSHRRYAAKQEIGCKDGDREKATGKTQIPIPVVIYQ
jgi:hypothetical protein